jgi:hypothetical protein
LYLFEKESCYIVQVGLKLAIFLHLPPKHWDSRHAPPHLTSGFSSVRNLHTVVQNVLIYIPPVYKGSLVPTSSPTPLINLLIIALMTHF